MNLRVFKMKFNKSLFDLNDDYDRLSEHEKENISEMNAESFFDYQDYNDNYICFIIAKPDEVQKYSSILIKNLIIHDVVDISQSVLKFKINIEDELNPLLSTWNSIKWAFFRDDLDSWILENLDIDSVLDRISEVGIENLTYIEKDFLNNFKL